MKAGTMMVLLGITFTLAVPCDARQASGGVRDVSVIQDGRGAARVLFRLQDNVRTLSEVSVWKATLRIPLVGLPTEQSIRLRIYPVTRTWSTGTVTWTGGWTREGGDFDAEIFAEKELDLRGAPTEIVLDVTRLLKETLEQRLAGDGFILSVDPRTGSGVSVTDLPRFAGLAASTLDVKYRKSMRASS